MSHLCQVDLSERHGLGSDEFERPATRSGDGGAPIPRARGRTSNNKLEPGVREYVLELIRRQYRDVGLTLAAEVLLERLGIKTGRETVRKWMVYDALWLSHKQRRTLHHPRFGPKTGYQKCPRQVYGPDYIGMALTPKAVGCRSDGRHGRPDDEAVLSSTLPTALERRSGR